ncbi:MAG: VWA domain-containing protein [Alistipes sp.]|nr:VWA domain-containing protein [Alistipes sp.]
MFRFGNPHYLWLLAAVPAAVVIYAVAARIRRRNLARFGNLQTLAELMPDVSTARMKLKFIIFATALAMVALAAARPRMGSKLREVKSRGIEMMIAVDVSNSMLAEDFAPNRLERTKYAVEKLFDELEQERVGLIAFAGEARVLLPVTSDKRMAKAFARRLSTDAVAEQGTAVGKALSLASMSFSSESGRSRAVILITDGENHEDDAVAAAERAAEQGIRIYTIGIGTPEGAPIEIGGEFVRDSDGNMVVSKLNEPMLEEIARITGGAYVRSTNRAQGLEEIMAEINALEKSETETLQFEEYNELFAYFAAAALVLLFVEMLLLGRRNPLLARFNIFGREAEEISGKE